MEELLQLQRQAQALDRGLRGEPGTSMMFAGEGVPGDEGAFEE